jgi:serine/threonine-protein kinase
VAASATPSSSPTVDPSALRRIAGHYEIRSELGAGGMGVVYEAMDLKLERRVAIKELRPEVAKSGRGRERFLAEARMVAKLSHPNIVTIHAIVEEQDALYLVFEYIDGATLDKLIDQKKRFSPAEALALLAGVADAVDYAHSQKVIHRDLKPSNIMVDRQGRPRVTDFGIAHQAKVTVSQLTMADAFGTYAYMPPEQALGHAVRESDVFSFAAVAYESLTGDLPFPGPDFHLQKMSLAFRRPSEALQGTPTAVDAAFERAFQPEAKKRFPTTGEFLAALRSAASAS